MTFKDWDIQKLGKRLLEKRGKRGLRDMAKEIGVSPATLSRIERGITPDLPTFAKLLSWLYESGPKKQSETIALDTPIDLEKAKELGVLLINSHRALKWVYYNDSA